MMLLLQVMMVAIFKLIKDISIVMVIVVGDISQPQPVLFVWNCYGDANDSVRPDPDIVCSHLGQDLHKASCLDQTYKIRQDDVKEYSRDCHGGRGG